MLQKWNHPSISTWSPEAARPTQRAWTRQLGLNEIGFVSYGSPNIKGPSDTFCRVRISTTSNQNARLIHDPAQQLLAWQILRRRHPLLDCQIISSQRQENAEETLSFRYTSVDSYQRAAATFTEGHLIT